MTTLFRNSYGAEIILDTEFGEDDGTVVYAHIETNDGQAQESKPLIRLLSGYWEKVTDISNDNWGTLEEPIIEEPTEQSVE
jgi:hypothetical protein